MSKPLKPPGAGKKPNDEITQNTVSKPFSKINPEETQNEISLNFDTLKYQEKRQNKRAIFYGSVAVYDVKGRVLARGKCVDLSKTGAGFDTKVGGLVQGDIVMCEFVSPSNVATFITKCRVSRLRSNKDGPPDEAQRVGVEFLELSQLIQKKIFEYLQTVFSDQGFGDQDI